MEDTPLALPNVVSRSIEPFAVIDHESLRALVLDDQRAVLEHLRGMLMHEDCAVFAFSSLTDAMSQLRQGLEPDLALISAEMEGRFGVSALSDFMDVCPTVPTIAASCSYDPRSVVKAFRMGAVDVLVHPFDLSDLRSSLEHCVRWSVARNRKRVREIPLSQNSSFVLCSQAMTAIASQCELIAPTDLPVLIMGESGTGKEILAHYIHMMSKCSGAAFLKVNCAAMPADLLESELLGYEQGAFTGAAKSKPGKFELCDHGTIFLDEIGEMSPALQAKLLQVLQDGTFSRLGGRNMIKVNVRVIAATNIDIKAAIAERRFREDLYYRINGFSVYLPPLRQRRDEIPVLIRYFMQKIAGKYGTRTSNMDQRLVDACMQYQWPGNLRELENFVKRYVVLGNEQAMISELVRNGARGHPTVDGECLSTPAGGLKKMLNSLKGEAEARVINAALERNRGKRKQTAAELRISYKALLYKMRQHGIIAVRSDSAGSSVHIHNSDQTNVTMAAV